MTAHFLLKKVHKHRVNTCGYAKGNTLTFINRTMSPDFPASILYNLTNIKLKVLDPGKDMNIVQ